MSRFVGLTREPVFSPGKVEQDRAILEMTAAGLRARGHEVVVAGAEEATWPRADRRTVVFTMSQGALALQRLQAWQAEGIRIVNAPRGILNCQRHRTVPLLAASDVPFPPSRLVDTALEPTVPFRLEAPGAWLKRGDVHATQADDVVFVDSLAAARTALQCFRARGISQVVVQQHVAGTVVKFYAVRGRFFHAVPPGNGRRLPPAIVSRMDAVGQQAARLLEVEVFGGDCVWGTDGAVSLIDFNDWPSYGACRSEAAKEISQYLLDVATL
jgi:hypothetical protein